MKKVLVGCLVLAACTQPAAQVELKGQQNFTRGAEIAPQPAAFSSPHIARNLRPVSQATEQTAAVSSIGVSDLAAPAKTASAPAPSPAPSPAPMTLKAPAPATTPAPASSKAVELKKPDAPVNPWTKKPRSGDESSVLSPEKKQPVAAVEEEPKHIASTKEFMWPVPSKKILSSFGPKGAGKANDGMNIAAESGEPVWAAADGEVVYVDNQLQGYGNMVIIKHSGTKTTSYAHLSRATVDKYERVKQGDVIGYVGSTGNVKKPQLYFSVREGKDPVDPRKYLSSEVAGL